MTGFTLPEGGKCPAAIIAGLRILLQLGPREGLIDFLNEVRKYD